MANETKPPDAAWVAWAVEMEEKLGDLPPHGATGGSVARYRRQEAFKKSLVRDDTVLGGWVFPGTKDSVWIVGMLSLADDVPLDAILKEYPALTKQQIWQAGFLKRETAWWEQERKT